MEYPKPLSPEELQAQLSEKLSESVAMLKDRAKTDPQMATLLRKKGIKPDA